MKSLKIVSLLIDYPNSEVAQATSEFDAVIDNCNKLSDKSKQKIKTLAQTIYGGDLMNAQEKHVAIFDRGRTLSLLLFEHVHGESRDRGQAMVDLMALYEKHGFEINVRELPDYIPLYLEFLSQRPEAEVVEGLADISHILAMISARLFDRKNHYHHLFDVLLELAHIDVDIDVLRQQASKEERDDSLEALDKIWEEEAVRFDGSDLGSCTSQQGSTGIGKNQTVPVHFIKDLVKERGTEAIQLQRSNYSDLQT